MPMSRRIALLFIFLGLISFTSFTANADDTKDDEIKKLKLELNASRDRELKVQAELATAKNAHDLKDAENKELKREVLRQNEEIHRLKGVIIKQQQAVVAERENAKRAREEKKVTE